MRPKTKTQKINLRISDNNTFVAKKTYNKYSPKMRQF